MKGYDNIMEWKPTKNPVGDKAMIFANGKDGNVYCDSVIDLFRFNFTLNKLMGNPEKHLICVKKNSEICNVCAFWIENNEWFPIIELNHNDNWCVCEDYIIESFVGHVDMKYIEM